MKLIGIDPGRSTGMAFWDTVLKKGDEQKLVLKTEDFWGCFNYITENYKPKEVAIFIEDPQKNKPTFGRNKMSKKVLDRKAQNVGSNKEQAHQLIEGLRSKGYVVFAQRPGSAKWTKKELKVYSSYAGRSNQHERDAARLVVGRTAVNPMQFKKLLNQ